ncbi:hypothetical protein RHGRI_012224 [Rhododendron griersonianum]|uniref:Uncharacterized protein n=1 Tax=Rhododendron griersonianum TaxID=479676 RepID=A0AAV6KQ94_9ERIC|nr:hypothetical protein RHGRI_012224 [Rhododendron griersonianum]
MTTFNDVFRDLQRDTVFSTQLLPGTTVRNSFFTFAGTALDGSPIERARLARAAGPPEPELDMQAVGWAIADHNNFEVPRINEWDELALEGFPVEPEAVPFDHVANNQLLAAQEADMMDPLDGFALPLLFDPPEPIIEEEPYFWDPEPAWQFLANYVLEEVVPDYEAFYT